MWAYFLSTPPAAYHDAARLSTVTLPIRQQPGQSPGQPSKAGAGRTAGICPCTAPAHQTHYEYDTQRSTAGHARLTLPEAPARRWAALSVRRQDIFLREAQDPACTTRGNEVEVIETARRAGKVSRAWAASADASRVSFAGPSRLHDWNIQTGGNVHRKPAVRRGTRRRTADRKSVV